MSVDVLASSLFPPKQGERVHANEFAIDDIPLHNCNFEFLADRNSTLKDVYNSMRSAKSCICIAGWPFSHDLQLDPDDTKSVLGDLLVERSKVIPVHVILWQDKEEISGNYFFKKANTFFTEAKTRGSKVQITSYSNKNSHSKFIICDGVGYVGSVDLSVGRANNEHPLFTISGNDRLSVSPKLNSDKTQPCHDVECRVTGAIVEVLAKAFEQLWRLENNAPRFELPKSTYVHDPNNLWNGQLIHTVPGVDETKWNIDQAYSRAIHRASKYIYIETQLMNLDSHVLHEIARQIIRNKHRDFKVIILISLCPEIRDTSKSIDLLQSLLGAQARNIREFLYFLEKASEKEEIHAADYIIFGCLGMVERRNEDKFEKDMIPVCSELLIVDDKYIQVGSKNLSQQFRDSSDTYETVVGASPEFTGQLETIRRSIFKKHFGEKLQDPSAPNFITELRNLGKANKKRFKRNEPFVQSNGTSTLFMNLPGKVHGRHFFVSDEPVAFFSGGSIDFRGRITLNQEHKTETGILVPQIENDQNQYRDEIVQQAAAIGLEEMPFQEYIQKISDTSIELQPHEFWIRQYLARNATEWLPSKESDSYKRLGFTDVRAQELADRISTTFAESYDAHYYAYRQTVDNQLSEKMGGYIALTGDMTSNTIYKRSGDREVTFHIFKKTGGAGDLKIDIAKTVDLSDKNSKYWFHGTLGVHAENILEFGIDPKKGRDKQDFSSSKRRGFYLGKSLDMAVQWVFDTWVDYVGAVLIYKVDKNLLQNEGDKHQDLTGNKDDWANTVRLCRNSEPHPSDKKVTSIYGPVCTNSGKLSRKKPKEKMSWFPTAGDADQLVLLEKSKSSILDTFNNSLYAIVWITKQEENNDSDSGDEDESSEESSDDAL
jgi:phosphatidylserine/phosphatidylglycerophosphate/cardiolipin synthase-like enzyme